MPQKTEELRNQRVRFAFCFLQIYFKLTHKNIKLVRINRVPQPVAFISVVTVA